MVPFFDLVLRIDGFVRAAARHDDQLLETSSPCVDDAVARPRLIEVLPRSFPVDDVVASC